MWTEKEIFKLGIDAGVNYNDYVKACRNNNLTPRDPDLDIRIIRLAKKLGVNYTDVEDLQWKHKKYGLYSVGTSNKYYGDYYVLTHDEAYHQAGKDLRKDIMKNSDEFYRNIDHKYIDKSRLAGFIWVSLASKWNLRFSGDIIDECIKEGILNEEDIYEIDEEASLEYGKLIFKDKYRDDVDFKWNEWTEAIATNELKDIASTNDGLFDYMKDEYGDDWILENNLTNFVDVEAYIKDTLNLDDESVAQQISTFDGKEIELGPDENGEMLYAYRVE